MVQPKVGSSQTLAPGEPPDTLHPDGQVMVQPNVEGSQTLAPGEPPDTLHPDDEAWWMHTMNQAADQSIHTQGCARPGPYSRDVCAQGLNTREDAVFKICGMLGRVVDIMDYNATRVLELQAHGGVLQSVRDAQHSKVMADNQKLRQEWQSMMAEIQRFSSPHVACTPQTPQTPETPSATALQPPLATQNAPHCRRTNPQHASGSATGCLPGCASCFPRKS